MDFERCPPTELAPVDLWSMMCDVPLHQILPEEFDKHAYKGVHTVVTESEAVLMLRRYEQYPGEAVNDTFRVVEMCLTGPQAADYAAGSDLLRLCVGLQLVLGVVVDTNQALAQIGTTRHGCRPDCRKLEWAVSRIHVAATCLYSSRDLLRQFTGSSQAARHVRTWAALLVEHGLEAWATVYAAALPELRRINPSSTMPWLVETCTSWRSTCVVTGGSKYDVDGWRATRFLHKLGHDEITIPKVRHSTPCLFDLLDWLGMWSEATLGSARPGEPYPLILPTHSVYNRIQALPRVELGSTR